MKHEAQVKSKRFYVYRHDISAENGNVMYRTDKESWSQKFGDAYLYVSLDTIKILATYLKAKEGTDDRKICIGAVNIEVDGFHVPILM